MLVFKEHSWVYILSVLSTMLFCFFAGQTMQCDCPDWVPLGLAGCACVALLVQLYYLANAVRVRDWVTAIVIVALIALSSLIGLALLILGLSAILESA